MDELCDFMNFPFFWAGFKIESSYVEVAGFLLDDFLGIVDRDMIIEFYRSQIP